MADAQQAKRIVGVGHQVFDKALAQAAELEPSVALIPAGQAPLALFRVQDAVTTDPRQVRRLLLGVTTDTDEGLRLLSDADCLDLLNQYRAGQADPVGPADGAPGAAAQGWLAQARVYLHTRLCHLGLPFRAPVAEDLALLWPVG